MGMAHSVIRLSYGMELPIHLRPDMMIKAGIRKKGENIKKP